MPAVTATVPTNCPTGIKIDAGLNAEALLLLNVIDAPPAGTRPANVTVTVAPPPLETADGLTTTDATVGEPSDVYGGGGLAP